MRADEDLISGKEHCISVSTRTRTYNCSGLLLNTLSAVQPLKQTLILSVLVHTHSHTHTPHKAPLINSKATISTMYPS